MQSHFLRTAFDFVLLIWNFLIIGNAVTFRLLSRKIRLMERSPEILLSTSRTAATKIQLERTNYSLQSSVFSPQNNELQFSLITKERMAGIWSMAHREERSLKISQKIPPDKLLYLPAVNFCRKTGQKLLESRAENTVVSFNNFT